MAAEAEQIDKRIGQTIGGRWKLERLLGSGGMATVYAAHDATGQIAALKVLHPEMARRSDVRERFLREAYVANRIGHEGVVRVLEHGEGDETYLVMELLEGEPLSARAQRPGDFTLRELLGYIDQLLDVLAAAHQNGVVHRDIKPDNVFITKTGQMKILDFGIARVLDDVPGDFKTRTGLALGTIPYMAPEQALGRRGQVDGRTDLFALGAMMFRILAGRRVHDEPSEAELLVAMATKPATKLASVAPNVPPNVCAIVDLALAFSKEARYPDARVMQGDVRAVLEGSAPPYASGKVVAQRDAPTRIDMVVAVPTLPGDAPTRAEARAPAPAPAVTAVVAAPAVTADAPPVSQAYAPASQTFLGGTVSPPLPPAATAGADGVPLLAARTVPVSEPPRRKSGVLLALIAIFGLLLVLGVLVVAAYFVFWRSEADVAGASSAGAPASAAPADPGIEAPEGTGERAAGAPTANTKASAEGHGAATGASKTGAPTLTGPTKTTSPTSPTTPGAQTSPASTGPATTQPGQPVAPPPTTAPPTPGNPPDKGKGHDKSRGKGHG